MKKILLSICLTIAVKQEFYSQGFAPGAMNWAVPNPGGSIFSGTNYSYDNLYSNGSGTVTEASHGAQQT
jgi:hypothetical protein